MKLAWKIFCAAYCIVMVTVGAGGFALVQAASDSWPTAGGTRC